MVKVGMLEVLELVREPRCSAELVLAVLIKALFTNDV